PNKSSDVSVVGTSGESQATKVAVIDSLPGTIKQLHELLEERFDKTENKMEKIVTNMKELSEVVDHDIMKRDQESDRFNRQLQESEKTTDRFKNETPILSEFNRSLMESEKTTDKFKKDEPALNVFMAARHELRSTSEGLVMEPYVEALPIQCVPVAKLTVYVEGCPLSCVIDSGAGPSLVVPEGIATMILAKKYGTHEGIRQAIIPPLGKVQIASCTGGDVPIVGQAIVNMRIGNIKCPTPMLVMKTDHERAECLLGSYGMTQMGFALFAPDGTELLGHDVAGIPTENLPLIKAPVKLPKTANTQISLLQCYSTKPLELGPLHRGQIKMKAPQCKEKGAYWFTPSDEGMAAGLRQESIKMGKGGNFKLRVTNNSAQQSINVARNVTIGTIGKAHLMEYGQFRAEVERREEDHQQKLRDNEQLQKDGLHNGRVEKLLQTVPFGPEATEEEKSQVQ
ncbi:MAG: hypothetical protein GY821_01030, partial [Gammaproteobacteria bacterium]|nr:hypothetical protein [Gammaproteobacteria bacterium]